MKICRICTKEKPLTDFNCRPDSPDGYRNECRECQKSRSQQNYQARRDERLEKQRRYEHEHKEDRREYARQYQAAHKEEIDEYRAQYREANRDKSRQYFREHYQQNRERALETKRQYRQKNRDAIRAWNNSRKARQRAAPRSDFTPKQWSAMKEAYDHRCVYCGQHFERLTMDHVIPLAKGGSHTQENIVPACMTCNNRKKTGPAPPMVVTPDWARVKTP